MKNNINHFYSNGKLLLAGEYLVLDGATALALPINKGQSLDVSLRKNDKMLEWNAGHLNEHWFSAKISIPQLEVIDTDNISIANRLVEILNKTRELKPSFLDGEHGFTVETNLEFLPWHGLGSSSTLVNNIANWAGVDAFKLQEITFGGSGYDIACANNSKSVFFKLVEGNPIIEEANFNPEFSDNIYFVYLGKKQRSIESIKNFRESAKYSNIEIREISNISRQLIECKKLKEFDYLIDAHERIMSGVLGRPTIKSIAFSDFDGSVKSLGGWGGDFVMMTTTNDKMEFAKYLLKKKLETFFPFGDLLI